MDQLYFEIDPNEGGWLLRLFMGNAEHETRQFPGGDDGLCALFGHRFTVGQAFTRGLPFDR
jgi:hypothetical protein